MILQIFRKLFHSHLTDQPQYVCMCLFKSASEFRHFSPATREKSEDFKLMMLQNKPFKHGICDITEFVMWVKW